MRTEILAEAVRWTILHRLHTRLFILILTFFFLLLMTFLVSGRFHSCTIVVINNSSTRYNKQDVYLREKILFQHLPFMLPEEVIDIIRENTSHLGILSLVTLRKNNLSALCARVSQEIQPGNNLADAVEQNFQFLNSEQDAFKGKRGDFITGKDGSTNDSAKLFRRQLRHIQFDAALLMQDDEDTPKLEKETIQRSKLADSAVLGDHKNEKTDSIASSMHDQIIMAKIYLSIASMKNEKDLASELKNKLKASQKALEKAATDSDLQHSAKGKMKAMSQVLAKARELLYDCKLVTRKMRALLQTADEQVRKLKVKSTFLKQLAAKTLPTGIHCLSMHLTIDYYLLPPEKRKFPRIENLENPKLYHYALFSDNVLAASVVVNSTIRNAKEPEKHVFHLVTDNLNFGAMSMWFLVNPPGKASIHVQNIDEFKWLNPSYCPDVWQLESAAMKDYYFKEVHPDGSSNLENKNPKYFSMLNHLRFYLPQVYPKLDKILFLDHDIVIQKDLTALWSVDLQGKVIGAVEICDKSFHRFDKYLNFSNPHIAQNFEANACGWAYGMNIFDLQEWKKNRITRLYHKWQSMNTNRNLWNWKHGTLPPGLLTFYRLTYPLEKSWHVEGLGYNPSLNKKEIENAAAIHYNGNMKPWLATAMSKYLPYWNKYIKYDDPYIGGCKLSE